MTLVFIVAPDTTLEEALPHVTYGRRVVGPPEFIKKVDAGDLYFMRVEDDDADL